MKFWFALLWKGPARKNFLLWRNAYIQRLTLE
jgi:hypothetical protein